MKPPLLQRLGMDWVDVALIVLIIAITVIAFLPWERLLK